MKTIPYVTAIIFPRYRLSIHFDRSALVVEAEKVQYGVTTGFIGHNPFKVVFLPLWQYIQGNWQRERDNLKDKKVMNDRPPLRRPVQSVN